MQFLLLLLLLITFQVKAETDFERGEKLYKQDKFEQAKPFFERYLKENPNSFKSIEYLGDIAGHQKQWDEAILRYKQLKIQFPKTANYFYKYGGALGMKAKSVNKFKALGMIDEVESAFLKAAELDANHIDTRWALVMLYIELPGIVGGSEKKAQKYANELMTLSKVDGYMAKGFIDEYFERYSEAEKDYIKAHQIGNSKTTFQKLYHLYLHKIKDKSKANKLKEQFEK